MRIHTSAAFLFLFLAGSLHAQSDTLRVQTLTFDSITTRRGWFEFPDDTHTYRKVLMHHTLKCDPQTTQDQYNCGEWDYLTYNFVHQHTGALDSTENLSPHYLVGTAAPAQVERVPYPIFDTLQRMTYSRSVLQVNAFSDHTVGVGAWGAGTFGTGQSNSRDQYLFTAAELAASGLGNGAITQLRFEVDQASNTPVDRFIIRMKATTANAVNTFDNAGLTTVHDAPFIFSSVGAATVTLTTPFAWDGTSNLLLEFACTAADQAFVIVAADSVGPDQLVQSLGTDNAVRLRDDHIGVDPALFADVDSAITIICWVYGDPDLPMNSILFEGVDAQGRRILNVHAPWSDSRVYWDAGNDGGGVDRIDKAATAPQIKGQWNHWAFVKNCATGSMKIYLNGALWHSGTGKTKLMSGITKFHIGAGANGGVPYPGLLDGFQVFNKELSAATISAWKDRRITWDHPDHANHLYHFDFEEPIGQPLFMNEANVLFAYTGTPMGTVQRVVVQAAERRVVHANAIPVRPTTTFVVADLITQLDSVVEHTLAEKPMLTQEYFEVVGNGIVPYDTLISWGSAQQYTIDPGGDPIDSVYATGTVEVNGELLWYGTPFEVVNDFEIGRYITPYGIGLSLGSQGFRWTYDVTDYQWLLHDSVELSAGNQQELIDLEFEMIEGTPPRTVLRHQRPWGGLTSRSYADLDNDVALPQVPVQLDPAASQWSLRTRLTGHGHNSNNGEYPHCCEWKDNTHYLDLNGTQLDEWHIWQENDCALNPVYPQGGTWLGSREGWCPGDLVKDHSVELPGLTGGGTAQLDYRITPVPANNQGMGGGNYVINMDLFEYGAAAHQLDAEIIEVKRPSSTDYHRRDNPICYDPLLVLRNAGAQDLTSVTFTYGVSGGNPQSWTWTGLLKHMERTDVVLPINSAAFWLGDSANVFTVTITAANGGSDQHAANDSYRTSFAMPVVYADNFIVNYKTNNRPQENSLAIRDVYGNVVFSRTGHTANTTYSDTMALFAGCYTIEFMDSGNDGLSYWADTQAGSGFFRLRKLNGVFLKTFEPEFGRKIQWPFTVGALVGLEEAPSPVTLSAFPNPTNGTVRVGVTGMQGPSAVEVMDASGRAVLRLQVELYEGLQLNLDLSNEASGLYQVRITSEHTSAQLRIMKQ